MECIGAISMCLKRQKKNSLSKQLENRAQVVEAIQNVVLIV